MNPQRGIAVREELAQEWRERCRLKGLSKLTDDYITKPFDGDELKVRVQAILALTKILQNNEIQDSASGIELTPHDKIFIDKWESTVEQHHRTPTITINELSGYMAMSSRQLLTKVKSLSGKGPKEFLDAYRIAKARKLLESKALNIAEVSEQVGFDNATHFAKRFKEVMKMSPRDYRKRW